MNEEAKFEMADNVIEVDLHNWFIYNCQNCPYYAGLLNEKFCTNEVQCLSDGAVKKVKEFIKRSM